MNHKPLLQRTALTFTMFQPKMIFSKPLNYLRSQRGYDFIFSKRKELQFSKILELGEQ